MSFHLHNTGTKTGKLNNAGTFTAKMTIITQEQPFSKADELIRLKEIKSNELTKRIPVVVVTSSKEDPDITAAYDLGANSYVVKPVDFDNFAQSIKQLGLYWLVINEKSK